MSQRRITAEWSEETALRDGTAVELRLVRPEDKVLFREGWELLSPESRYRRFLSIKEVLTEPELRYLTEVDGEHHVAIGMMAFDPILRPLPVGIGRFIVDPLDPTVAEPAVAVVDPMQSRGAGRLLLERLVEAARERGIQRFRAEVFVDNGPMLALLDEFTAAHTEVRAGDVVVYEFNLEEAPGTSLLQKLLDLVAKGLLSVRGRLR
jgi:GNAT superfamily N-acetyltransferase